MSEENKELLEDLAKSDILYTETIEKLKTIFEMIIECTDTNGQFKIQLCTNLMRDITQQFPTYVFLLSVIQLTGMELEFQVSISDQKREWLKSGKPIHEFKPVILEENGEQG